MRRVVLIALAMIGIPTLAVGAYLEPDLFVRRGGYRVTLNGRPVKVRVYSTLTGDILIRSFDKRIDSYLIQRRKHLLWSVSSYNLAENRVVALLDEYNFESLPLNGSTDGE